MTRKLEGKNALITGGSNGIGRAIGKAFADAGANIYFTYNSDTPAAEAAATELLAKGAKVGHERADLTTAADYPGLLDRATEAIGDLDVLVNNAGTVIVQDFLDAGEADFDKMIAIHCRGPYFLTQHFARRLIARGAPGSIINVSSLAAHHAGFRTSTYAAGKGGMNSFSRGAALELAPHKIRVNVISPGGTLTAMLSRAIEADPALKTTFEAGIPMGHLGSPDDFGPAAVFYASDDSAWITGTNLNIDGGMDLP